MSVKRFFNRSEEVTNAKLILLAQELGLRIQPKAKLSDVFLIENSGISNEDYSYALMAHFDFLIMNEDWIPLFAVEFDGPGHGDLKQIERDKKKDRLCEKFGFSILRIDSQFTNIEIRQMSLLSWLCKIWLFEKDFSEAQEAGTVPSDEPFLWFSVAAGKLGDPFTYPYDISLPSRLYLMNLSKTGKSKSSFLRTATYESNGRVYAEAYFRLTDDSIATGVASVKQFRFRGIAPYEVAEELATIDAAEKVKLILGGAKKSHSNGSSSKTTRGIGKY